MPSTKLYSFLQAPHKKPDLLYTHCTVGVTQYTFSAEQLESVLMSSAAPVENGAWEKVLKLKVSKSVVRVRSLRKTQAAVLINSPDLKQATFFQVTCVQEIMFWGFTDNYV